MTSGPDRTVAAALERIIVAGVALTTRAIATAQPGMDLSFPQWRVLVVLGEAADGMRISEVAQRVGVTLPATSRQIRRLERRGLVAVGPDQDDRRASRVRLTAHGHTALHAIRELRRGEIGGVAKPFERRANLRRDLAEVADAFEGDGRSTGERQRGR